MSGSDFNYALNYVPCLGLKYHDALKKMGKNNPFQTKII